MGFADLRKQLRQAVHKQFGYVAVYTDKAGVTYPEIGVRSHSKFNLSTDDMTHDHSGARFVVGLSTILFDKQELAAAGITVAAGGKLLLTELGITMKMKMPLPDDGQEQTDRWVVEQAS